MMRLVVLVMMLLAHLAKGSPPMVKPKCRHRCGNLTIPFPFGMDRRDCYEDEWFEINCTDTKPFLPRLNMEVLDISFGNNSSPFYDDSFTSVTVKGPIKSNNNCTGIHEGRLPINLTETPFYINDANEFVVVGCDTSALMNNRTTPEIIGCNSRCIPGQESLVSDWPQVFKNLDSSGCNGSNNCCQAPFSRQAKVFNPIFQDFDGGDRGGCSLAFIADIKWLYRTEHKEKRLAYVPLRLSWESRYDYDSPLSQDAASCSMRSEISTNVTTTSDCRCQYGYEGNPYLGCIDIDECKSPERDRCKGIMKCENTSGYFKCVVNPVWIVVIVIAGVIGILAAFFGSWGVYKLLKRRSKTKLRKKFFKRNGGLLLQQQVTSVDDSLQKTKIYKAKELEKATDNFNESRILGQGGQGTVYKGMLADGRIVAVKKSTLVDEEKLHEFINEVVLLSQINHRNVVKLLGCCLETEVPLLVYEFIPNGSLFQYIHDLQEDDVPLSWELRLQIATEVAGAVAYLHSAASSPIYHRDIKSTNILLDEKFRAKVSDFGTSRSITIDQTHLTTHVQGTMGYLDPEYFQSSQFTAKSDVYSFGVVLVELLSGQKPICWERSEESRSLTAYFNFLMEKNKMFEIVDDTIMQQKHEQQIIAVANLAKRCLNLYGRFRPNMKEVAIELECIRSSSTTIQQNTQAIAPNASPSVVSCDYKDSMSDISFDVEPLISYQTW